MASNRPNILFFLCDQLTPFALSPYRQDMAITPTFQHFADRGVTFTSAYCNNPLCTPSRASLMAGRYGSQIGVYDNAGVLHADQLCLTHYLREAGYHAVLSGKMHFIGPDQLHGFTERLTTDIYPGDISWIPNWSLEKARGAELGAVLQSTSPLDGTMFTAYDDEATFRAVQWLRHYARSERLHEDPFFLCVSLTNPHHPYLAPKELWDLYENREIPMPTVPRTEPDNANARWIWEAMELDNNSLTDEQIRDGRRAYLACTTFVDRKLEQIVETLDALGLSDDTWVILASDHGDMIGERGFWYKKLFYEYSARVPLIIAPPGGMAPQRRDQPVSLVDLLPTFADIGQTAEPESDLPGRSLRPLLDDAHALADRPCVMEYMGSSMLGSMRMVRQGAYKYVTIHPTGEQDELLFNIEKDPEELHNLIDDPQFKAVADRMRKLATADGWDGQAMNQRVRASQAQRRFLKAAMSRKKTPTFSYVPPAVDPEDPEMFGLGLRDSRR